MKDIKKIAPFLLACMLFLTGCWDDKLLKDTSFVLSSGHDFGPDGKVKGTYTTPNADNYPSSTIVTTTNGHTIREVIINLNAKVAESLDVSKLKVIFFEDKLVEKNGIFDYVDIDLKDPQNPLSPYIAVTEGKSEPFFTDPIPNQGIPSEYYLNLIRSNINEGIFTDVNVFKSSRVFHNEGSDLVVPYMKKSKDKTPIAGGLALFDGGKFTGKTLNINESSLYNMLNGTKSKLQPELIEKITSKEDRNINNYVSLNVVKSKRDMKISVEDGKAKGKIMLKMEIQITEAPSWNVTEYEEYLQKALEKQITKDANAILDKLQKANCDGLSIGRHLMAFDNKDFKKLNWKENDYEKADVKVECQVKIINYTQFE